MHAAYQYVTQLIILEQRGSLVDCDFLSAKEELSYRPAVNPMNGSARSGDTSTLHTGGTQIKRAQKTCVILKVLDNPYLFHKILLCNVHEELCAFDRSQMHKLFFSTSFVKSGIKGPASDFLNLHYPNVKIQPCVGKPLFIRDERDTFAAINGSYSGWNLCKTFSESDSDDEDDGDDWQHMDTCFDLAQDQLRLIHNKETAPKLADAIREALRRSSGKLRQMDYPVAAEEFVVARDLERVERENPDLDVLTDVCAISNQEMHNFGASSARIKTWQETRTQAAVFMRHAESPSQRQGDSTLTTTYSAAVPP